MVIGVEYFGCKLNLVHSGPLKFLLVDISVLLQTFRVHYDLNLKLILHGSGMLGADKEVVGAEIGPFQAFPLYFVAILYMISKRSVHKEGTNLNKLHVLCTSI